MARQNIREESANRISTGYEGTNVPPDFTIPFCGVEDVDRALFNLFDKEMSHPLFIGQDDDLKKVPVIFATGERFALVKRKIPIRDKNNTLILPLVSLARTGVEMVLPSEYGLPGAVGPLTIKKRLSAKDQRYQQLINRFQLKNQNNVASRVHFSNADTRTGSKPGTVASRRIQTQTTAESYDFNNGRLLAPDIGNNIFEVITIPFPKFFKTTYEVTFWTQYTLHMNQMLENLVNSTETQGKNFKIRSDKGYWFVAYLDLSLSPANNFDDFSSDERIVKYTFSMYVYAYLIANNNPGQLSPMRYKLSAPQINFGIFSINAPLSVPGTLTSDVGTGDINKLILDGTRVLDKKGNPITSDSQVVEVTREKITDPFTGDNEFREVTVVTRNQRKGETVARSRIIRKVDEFSM